MNVLNFPLIATVQLNFSAISAFLQSKFRVRNRDFTIMTKVDPATYCSGFLITGYSTTGNRNIRENQIMKHYSNRTFIYNATLFK